MIFERGNALGKGLLDFQYWRHPYVAMKERLRTSHTGHVAGLFSTPVRAAFGHGGVGMGAAAAGGWG